MLQKRKTAHRIRLSRCGASSTIFAAKVSLVPLHRVAVNTVLGRMRKSRREQDRIRAVSDAPSTPGTIGDSGGLRDLEQAIDQLPSGARHVFVLHAVYGYSHDETGDMLGIAAGTSKAQLHRARRLLVQQLKTDCA